MVIQHNKKASINNKKVSKHKNVKNNISLFTNNNNNKLEMEQLT